MRRWVARCTAGVTSGQPALVTAFDDMWTYRQARRRGKRLDSWGGGRQWCRSRMAAGGDFETGDRSAEAFLRIYKGLPEAELYRTDGYRVYGCRAVDHHQVGKGLPLDD